jgi:NAD+ synthase
MRHAQRVGIRTETVDITPNLDCFGIYEKRDEAIRRIFPEYNSKYKSKIILPPELLSKDSYNFFKLVIDDSCGNIKSVRLDNRGLREIMAATNVKQRTRMMNLYYFAERNNYLVCGTTNKTETIQGFFVKYGDGGVDIEPIAQLYKTQVYQLAAYLGVEKEILERVPSPDTYSLNVTDEEFYFRIPYDTLDLLLYAWDNDVATAEVREVMALTEEQVKRVFRDFTSKYIATKHLRTLPPTPELLV